MPETSAVTCRPCQPPGTVDGNIFDHLRLFHPGWDEGGIPVTDVTAPFSHQVYDPAEFEHGLLCGDCSHEFQPGEPYTERPEGFAGDTPMVILVCLRCARENP